MAAWQIFKVNRKTFFNPTAWLNVGEFRDNNRAIWDSVSGLFSVPAPTRTETFEQAVNRLGLTDDALHQTEQNYFAFAWFFAIIGVITFIFSFVLLFYHKTVAGWLIAMPAAGLFLAQGFRYHFWYFQIKNRKLGCTLKEWRNGKVDHEEKAP